jgi:hypothetical protein
MTSCCAFALLGGAMLAAQQAPIPAADELSGHPLVIKNKWVIGGSGKWDYLTLDPVARQLFIAHQTMVQVVNTETGAVAGEIGGFGEAHAVVLDPDGQVGYATDGRANVVRIFDRRTYRIQSSIDVGCSPRSITFELQSRLLFAICGANPVVPTPPRRPRATHRPGTQSADFPVTATGGSHVIIVDAEAQRMLVDIAVPGDFRIAQSDDNGQVYVTVGSSEEPSGNRYPAHMSSPPRIARLDAAAIAAEVHRQNEAQHRDDSTATLPVRWQTDPYGSNSHVRFLQIDRSCANPLGLAIDSH